MTVRFKDGSIATDRELNCVALAFGFSSWTHMRREFMAADIRRDGASRELAAQVAAEEIAREARREAYLRERKEKDEKRRENQRAARLAVVARKRAEKAAAEAVALS